MHPNDRRSSNHREIDINLTRKEVIVQRVAFTMRIKDGEQGEYIRRHREVWSEALAELQQAGVHTMSIFINGTELFVYMEVEDYARAVRILSESPHSIRWEEYMAPIMEGPSGNVFEIAYAYPESLPEVFFWERADEHRAMPSLRSELSSRDAPSPPHFGKLKESVSEL